MKPVTTVIRMNSTDPCPNTAEAICEIAGSNRGLLRDRGTVESQLRGRVFDDLDARGASKHED